ncbi:MAG: bifunctional [glutamate--ammonia ligase]-adenylyl-L-tyrosine phosphorylase/[glutamate--ammonia-ligase] adenylyltransferase [Steroidobacteraceae bacterium]
MSPELQQQLASARAQLRADPRAAAALDGASASVQESVDRVLIGSDFVLKSCVRDPALLEWLVTGATLTDRRTPAALRLELGAELTIDVDDPADDALLMTLLRAVRRREMVRIAWRDLAGWADLDETLGQLSTLADTLITTAVQAARAGLLPLYGLPRDAAGAEQSLIVVAMGKLGGGELNFSSDVDLIFLFSTAGDTDGRRSISNEEYFTRLGRQAIKLMDQPTADGFVLRVDMRLRPFGDSGPLVVSETFLEDYLETHGRDWERYAWVKARAVTGASQYGSLYEAAIRPFVYRRYLDFGVFDALRDMKALIEREVARRDLTEHVKLGPGGIREIEFIVQAMQLIRGGQDRRLQTTSLRTALPRLVGSRLLDQETVDELDAAYVFLRRLENALQMADDQQTHTLPTDVLARERLAVALGFVDWPAADAALAMHRANVVRQFQALLFANGPAREAGHVGPGSFAVLWEQAASAAEFGASFERNGIADAADCGRQFAQFRSSNLVKRLDATGRKRLDVLMALIATELTTCAEPAAILRRVIRILEAIGARSTYFSLLNENEIARRRLIELSGYGGFLSKQIAAAPILLDELIDESLYGRLPRRAELMRDVTDKLASIDADDPEREVEALRHFQRAAIFRVAVSDLSGRLPLMRISDYLTEIAEIIVEHAMRLAWKQMTTQYGVPCCGMGPERRTVRVCAVGYGKLGGRELGYGSDLDLVFLHDSVGEDQETDAPKPVDNQMFFVRLAQRIVHILTMHSSAGRLYEVDVRLRPSGKGGLLITQVDAFAEYQRNEAWTWEHQALLHARAVAGDPELQARFERVRTDILCGSVKHDTLRKDVGDMRERMRRELSRSQAGQFDVKQDRGGVADIEFLAQYWALAFAPRHAAVVMYSDTIRQLETVASGGYVPQATVDQLTAAYRAYRARTHRLSLEDQKPIVPTTEFQTERSNVTSIWEQTLGATV